MKTKRRALVIVAIVALVLVGLVVLLSRRDVQLYKVTVLPSLGATFTRPEAVNDHGQVAGFSHRVKNRPEAFIWDKTNGMRSLTPDERQYGEARAINDANQVLYREIRTSPFTRFSIKYFPPQAVHSLWDPKSGKIVLDNQIPSKMGKLLDVLITKHCLLR